MKKYIKYSFLMLFLAFNACNNEVDDLFDKTAAQRLNEIKKNAADLLSSSANGWELRYFPNPESPGYSMLVKFDKNTLATIAAKNIAITGNRYKTDQSLWEVIGDNGPVLTFNSYNEILHAFSDPQKDGIGRGGDYEFIILSSGSNEIKLKGKKHEAYMNMYPLDVDLTWEDYFKKIDEFNAVAFTGNNGFSFDFSDGKTTREATYSNNSFTFTNADESKTSYGFVSFPEGIQFHSGIPVNGKLAVNFIIADDNSSILCIDEGVDAKFFIDYSALEYLQLQLNAEKSWEINVNEMSVEAKSIYEEFARNIKNTGAAIRDIKLQYSNSRYSIRIGFRLNGKDAGDGILYGDFVFSDNTMQFVYQSADKNGLSLFKRAGNGNEAAGKALIVDNFFAKTYHVSSESAGALNYSTLRLTDVNNPEFSYIIKR